MQPQLFFSLFFRMRPVIVLLLYYLWIKYANSFQVSKVQLAFPNFFAIFSPALLIKVLLMKKNASS